LAIVLTGTRGGNFLAAGLADADPRRATVGAGFAVGLDRTGVAGLAAGFTVFFAEDPRVGFFIGGLSPRR
jgi:hypothetical protein